MNWSTDQNFPNDWQEALYLPVKNGERWMNERVNEVTVQWLRRWQSESLSLAADAAHPAVRQTLYRDNQQMKSSSLTSLDHKSNLYSG